MAGIADAGALERSMAGSGRGHNNLLSIEPDLNFTEAHGNTELSVQQLQAAVVDLLMALSSTLSDERDSAEEYLSRAAEILHTVEKPPVHVRQQAQGGLAPWQIRKVTLHIETNLGQPIRSQDLAAILSLNPCHFSRAFRNSFGASPLEYIIRRRIERAQGLMLSTDAPLSQIALECGLADQAHFSRLFRRTVGQTPRTWRRARVSPAVRDFPADVSTAYMQTEQDGSGPPGKRHGSSPHSVSHPSREKSSP
jgi:AraC family transcriptional regulator